MGVLIAYPFSSGDVHGTVNYRSTETVYFNEYWYENEKVKENSQITYELQSNPNPVSFIITNHPMSQFPVKTVHIPIQGQFEIAENEYFYYQQFLYYGSSIQFSYTANSSIDFLIVDGNNAGYWNENSYYKSYVEMIGPSNTGVALADASKDYYLIFYNPTNTTINVTTNIDFNINNVPDFSKALVCIENVTNVPKTTVTVPTAGDWYFFVFFDPVFSSEYSTMITFDVTYETGITSADRWGEARTGLIVFAVILVGIIAIAAVARRQQKVKGNQPNQDGQPTPQADGIPNGSINSTTPTVVPQQSNATSIPTRTQSVSPTTTTIPSATQYRASTSTITPTPATKICHACNATVPAQATFCHECGAKQEGRAFGKAPVQPKANLQFCYYCGGKIEPNQRFCAFCGAKTEQD
jgi:hypothetical protein